jgi:hypothetical protein
MLLVMAILGGSTLGWLAWQTEGQVLLHLFRYNQTAFSITRAAFGLLMNLRHVAGLLALAGGASLSVLKGVGTLSRRQRWDLLRANLGSNRYRRMVLLLAVYSMLAASSALTFGKEGSDINYFLEWNVSLAPLAGILLFRAALPVGPSVSRPGPHGWRPWHYQSCFSITVSIKLVSAGFASSMDRCPPIGSRSRYTGGLWRPYRKRLVRYSPKT